MAAATIPFSFETVHTPEVLLAGTLFLRGLGLGLTMMPITAAAYFNLSHADVPRASTTINIVRQVGGSVAVALFAVVLERQIIARAGAHAASAVTTNSAKLPPRAAALVAEAFAHTFWWAVATILLAFIPTLFLPAHAPRSAPSAAVDDEGTPAALPAPQVVFD
jgi:hypothetical protein